MSDPGKSTQCSVFLIAHSNTALVSRRKPRGGGPIMITAKSHFRKLRTLKSQKYFQHFLHLFLISITIQRKTLEYLSGYVYKSWKIRSTVETTRMCPQIVTASVYLVRPVEVLLISVKGGRRVSSELRGNSTISTLLAQPLTVVGRRASARF
ncbi:hypothetical protein DBV15_10100 [Temnothorax longispinosus]|uniref:Uncharacterized protein n=1 Tax=Temnothorax longispinosus TaxID=300112 RepID=A0A4S2J9X1_9HYME|nr:hypothetical protein DBV15_10100 [Temnothorax longispinosus]